MKFVAAVLLLAFGFWAGHAYSSYQMMADLLPALQRSQALHLASFMLRSAELIDANELGTLRHKQLGVARSQIDPLPVPPVNWRTVLALPSLGPGEEVEHLRAQNDANANELRKSLEALANRGNPSSSKRDGGS